MNKWIGKYNLLKTHWLQLTLPKKRLFLFINLCIGLVLYYLMIWSPFSEALLSLRQELIKDQDLITWTAEAQKEMTQMRGQIVNIRPTQSSSLFALIDQEAKSAPWGAFVNEIKQIENNQVEMSFNSIPFEELIEGMEQLWEKFMVQVVKINVSRAAPPNLVKAKLICSLG